MDKDMMIAAFNEWLRRYNEDPASHDAELQRFAAFFDPDGKGDVVATYGAVCAEYMFRLADEISAVS